MPLARVFNRRPAGRRAVYTFDRFEGFSVRSTAPPSRSAAASGHALATLVALAAALVAAFVVARPTLAASRSGGGFVDERHLTETVREAFVEYWRSDDRDLCPGLQRVIDYWFRYHVAKAVIA